MPYKRKTRRRFPKRRTFRRRFVKMPAVEKKTSIINFSSQNVPDWTVGSIDQSLTDINQGLTQTNRIGNSVHLTSLYGDFFLTGADTTNSVRMILYIPKNVTTTLSTLAFNAAPDLDQVTILQDRLLTFSSNGNNCRRFKIKKKFDYGRRKGIHCTYTDGTGTNITKNRLRLLLVSDSTVAPHPVLNGFLRIFYTDV